MLSFLVLLLVTHCTRSATVTKVPVLADGVEHIIQLNPAFPARLHFNMPGPEHPLWMYVTPCGGIVHWQLFLNDRTNKYDSNVNNVAPKEERFNEVVPERIPPLVSAFGGAMDDTLSLLAGEADDKRMAFHTHLLHSDSVALLLSSDVHSTARVLITSEKWRLDEQYPPVPSEPAVVATVLHTHQTEFSDVATVRIKWNIPKEIEYAQRASQGTLNRYRFCAVVSRKQPVWTICDELGEDLESIHCVNQTSNSLDIANMRSGRKYFVTVFFRDALSGGTSALRPVALSIPETQLQKERPKKEKFLKDHEQTAHRLADARLQVGKLAPFRGATQTFEFAVEHATDQQRKILLVLHACDGYIRVAIYRDGRLLRRSDAFSGFRRFLVTNAIAGRLTLQIINDDSKAKLVRLWASTNPAKSPYPQLPDDTSIKETRRTCSSTTLQWLKAGDSEITYCLYRRKETVHYLEELVSKHANLCSEKMPPGDLVGCYSHFSLNAPSRAADITKLTSAGLNVNDERSGEEVDGIIETTVSGLDSDTTYRFDLLAQPLHRPHTQQLPYRTVWVKTRAFC